MKPEGAYLTIIEGFPTDANGAAAIPGTPFYKITRVNGNDSKTELTLTKEEIESIFFEYLFKVEAATK